ncbi:hypothetical protein KGF56_001193 [Candida oxycetoniae]|uniref:NDT80 domain-containing protein n=1 Tax=Candida oxycetoniae TaxID=497107 RepID=A0AAI9SZT0_9ASCO|nr:uncharacterized protein KGF56_001193 [Candida oxycetoniae]KAI3405974.2 hypothetical protein KGF56_001193 [Candida oxycetoniae]
MPKKLASSEVIKSDPIYSLTAYEKKKVAPRSSEQFKIGPPFGNTIQVAPLFINCTHQEVHPEVFARIDRGFDSVKDLWIGYRRNYFSVVSCFQFREFGAKKSIFQEGGFYIKTLGKTHAVKRFALRLVGKCSENNVDVRLSQHTAKRDKGPIFEPPIIPAIPGTLPSHLIIKQSSNVRKISRLQEVNHLFTCEYGSLTPKCADSILHNYDKSEPYVKVAKYDRIQFATSLNRKVPSMTDNKKLSLQVQLLAELEPGNPNTYAVVAVTNTPPFFIRGRSPSTYSASLPRVRCATSPLKRVINVPNFDNVARYVHAPAVPPLTSEDNKENFDASTFIEVDMPNSSAFIEVDMPNSSFGFIAINNNEEKEQEKDEQQQEDSDQDDQNFSLGSSIPRGYTPQSVHWEPESLDPQFHLLRAYSMNNDHHYSHNVESFAGSFQRQQLESKYQNGITHTDSSTVVRTLTSTESWTKIRGTLKSVDQFLNLKLDNIICINGDKYPYLQAVKNLFIRGSTVRYVHMNPNLVDCTLLQDASRRDLQETASFADSQETASFADSQETASFADSQETASFADSQETASFADSQETASFADSQEMTSFAAFSLLS